MQDKEYRFSGSVRYDFSACLEEDKIQIALKTSNQEFETLYKCHLN